MNARAAYWDAAAATAEFTLPVDFELLERHVATSARVLDFGCGYGRTLHELDRRGYARLAGLDASAAMLARAARTAPAVPVCVGAGAPAPFRDGSFDAVLLLAVLTCIPEDDAQRALVAELDRLLRPGGVVYAVDFLIRSDARSHRRYEARRDRRGVYGVFETADGAVVRHHDPRWIRDLFARFELLDSGSFEATTMRGNPATALRLLGRKREPTC